MDTPATFEPLVTDYSVEWDEGYRFGDLPEGVTFEHGHIRLENGYTVSIARTNIGSQYDLPNTIGYDEGKWEACLMKDSTNPLGQVFGQALVPAEELDDLTNADDPGGHGRLVAPLDNAAVNALLSQVAQRPAVETFQMPDSEEDIMAMLSGLFGEPTEVTSEDE